MTGQGIPVGETEHLSAFDGRATVSAQYATPALMDDLVEVLHRHGFPLSDESLAEAARRKAERQPKPEPVDTTVAGIGRIRLGHETLMDLFGLPLDHRVIAVEQHEDPTQLVITVQAADFPPGENTPMVFTTYDGERPTLEYTWPSRTRPEITTEPPANDGAAAAASIVSELQRSKRGRR